MYNDLTQVHTNSENRLTKGFATFVLATLLTACGAGGEGDAPSTNAPDQASSYVDDPNQPETAIEGRAVKGTITNGIVRAYEVTRKNGEYVFDTKPYRNAVETDENGNYVIRFRGKVSNSTFMIEMTADADTRMVCDVVDGCLDADGNMTAFGDSFPLANDFQMLGIISGVTSGDAITANLTPLTHMAVNYAMALDGGLSASNISTAKRHVEGMLSLDQESVDISPVDIANLGQSRNVSKAQLKSSVVSAAFLGLVNTPQWNDIADVLTHLSNKMIESGSLRTASSGLEQDISLEDLFYEASNLTQDLIDSNVASELNGTLSEVRSETQVAYQTAASSEGSQTIDPVTITSNPQSVEVTEGQSAALTVAASGGGTLSFQWLRNGEIVVGAVSNTLTFESTQVTDSGVYTVVVSNSQGSVTSLAALLTVNEYIAPVSIQTQPVGQTVVEGANVSFSVGASGGGALSYQWRKDGKNINGGTQSTLSLSGVTPSSAGSYDVVVSNSEGSLVSSSAMLYVNEAPVVVVPVSITTQPANVTVDEGSNAQFSVGVTGGGTISFQWYRGSSPISGATSSTLVLANVSSSDAGAYHVVVNNSANTVSSDAASLTVNVVEVVVPVEISKGPVSQVVVAGDLVQFSVIAAGSGDLRYQWLHDGVAISGATSSTLNLGVVELADAGTYSVTVTSGDSSDSAAATLVVNQPSVPVEITAGPVSQVVMAGDRVAFGVTASGTGELSYQWFHNGVALIGETSSTTIIVSAELADAGTYSVTVDNGGSQDSASATLGVEVPVVQADIELSWDLPTTREDQSELTQDEIAGYVIVWGANSGSLVQTLNVDGVNNRTALLEGLEPGTYYFAIATLDVDGMQGSFSPEIRVDAM